MSKKPVDECYVTYAARKTCSVDLCRDDRLQSARAHAHARVRARTEEDVLIKCNLVRVPSQFLTC